MNKAILHFDEYEKYLNEHLYEINEEYHKYFYGRWNETEVMFIDKSYVQLIDKRLYNNELFIISNTLEKARITNSYILNNGFYWTLKEKINKYCVIEYGKTRLFVLEKFIDIVEVNTYTDYTPIEVRQLLLNDTIKSDSYLPSELKTLSINEVKKEQKEINSKMTELMSNMEDVCNNKNEELAILQKEIEEKTAILNKKKEIMMQNLNDKMNKFEAKLKELKNQIYMLKTEIYSIRCFAGETIELLQIRTGKSASIETPVVLNQKILYLDEDLAKTMSIYTNNIEHNYKILEEVLKHNDTVMEMFCPQSKSVSFFKCSKSGKSYEYCKDDDILQAYDMLHGNKMGFVVRNGENLYIGWLEEEWDTDNSDRNNHILTFDDSVIYKPENKNITVDEKYTENSSTPIEHVVSRMFAISILQGLIEYKEILTLPKNVKISVPSKYVIHNYANAWLEDNRYGDFATLVTNLHYYNKAGDTILLVTRASESNQKPYESIRSRGEKNTTRDCTVSSGLNTINLIEKERIFISAKKDSWGWHEYKNNANFEIDKDEFINLTFMNSDWLKYYIDTKKIGDFGCYKNTKGFYQSLEYAYLIKYFKIAYEYIMNREKDEELLINKYIDNLEQYNWKSLLSHWKIKNNIRVITDYQAQRFAKYLKDGDYYVIKHLFDDTFKYPKSPNLFAEFFATNMPVNKDRQHRYCTSDKNSEYGWKDDKFVDKKFTNDTPIEDIKEREVFDEQKIKLIRKRVLDYANEYHINIANNKYFIKQLNKILNDKTLNYLIGDTLNVIVHNICVSNCNYNDIKEYFIKNVKKCPYHYWQSMDEKLYHLAYIRVLQDDIYPYILKCIDKTITHDRMHEAEKI